MKVGKPMSKRTPVRLRHKIQKASANKQRKAKRDAKKNPEWRSRLKKDPGIPNLFPYKDKVLAEIEETKRLKEEDKERRKELARAQREGKAVAGAKVVEADEDDEELEDAEDLSIGEDDEMETESSANPMAALLASAQARAQQYTKADSDEEEEGDEDDDADLDGLAKGRSTSKAKATAVELEKKKLPKQVVDEPIKPINRLLARLEQTPDGMQQLLAYYKLPPLVTAGSDTTTRFLIDIARKRGRLGPGGVPNLNAAALTVLSDLNDERLKLPALSQKKTTAATEKGEVQIIQQLAEPFRIEGLFGDAAVSGEMGVET